MLPLTIRAHKLRVDKNRLEEIRKARGLKQPDIAEAMGVSVPQVSRWENSVDAIPSTRLASMAAAYQCTVGEIFEESPTPLTEPVARLAVRHVAQAFGVSLQTEDPRIESLALDLKELAEFAARPGVREELAQATGFLAGRKTIRLHQGAAA
jgi:transcriptional regulator with XRE-family HTH domain